MKLRGSPWFRTAMTPEQVAELERRAEAVGIESIGGIRGRHGWDVAATKDGRRWSGRTHAGAYEAALIAIAQVEG